MFGRCRRATAGKNAAEALYLTTGELHAVTCGRHAHLAHQRTAAKVLAFFGTPTIRLVRSNTVAIAAGAASLEGAFLPALFRMAFFTAQDGQE